MSEVDYHVLAVLPVSPNFSVGNAIDALGSDGYCARIQEGPNGDGIRLELDGDGWGLVAWLENDDEARELIQELASGEVPATISADEIAKCESYLSIWSDNDPDFMNGVEFEEMVEFIVAKLGGYVFDNRLGEWRE